MRDAKRKPNGGAAIPAFRPKKTVMVAALWWIVLAVACGTSSERSYDVRGVVESVRPEDMQLIVAHEDVPGLMPAMTMNFDIEDPVLFEGIAVGDAIRFELVFTGRAYVIRAIERLGEGQVSGAWPELARNEDPLPAFSFRDQHEKLVSDESLRGKVVLLDFIYTNCPGPCPILTGVDVEARRQLDDLADRVVFCSVTLDPERDDPAALAAYAKARGADFDNWHFLTGEAEEVKAFIRSLGVASSPGEDGEIDHMLARFLIDPEGRIRKRYLGMTHTAEALAGSVRQLAGSGS